MILYTGQFRDTDYDIENRYIKKKHKREKYCNDIFVLDIEVTSAWLTNHGIIGYEKGKEAEYWNQLIPLSLPYIWQFSINDTVYYGREFRDLFKVFSDLPAGVKYIIWVHNLSYEFQFLNNIFQWKTVFARTAHKVMKCVPEEFPNIEFRCSYFLTRLSLESWGKQLGCYKLKGDLDYEMIRTPKTVLRKRELDYCERDCIVVYNGIKDYLKRYKNQWDIPLTQTGTVRREVKSRLVNQSGYLRFIKKLIPTSAERYALLQKIFAGGYTHANRLHAGIVQEGYIEHYDFASSYPTVMVAEKYPMSPWAYTGLKEIPPEETFDTWAYIFYLEFTKIECKTFNTYIQASKCAGKNIRFDNGRVISADYLGIYVTEQDYLTIKETYKWEDLKVSRVYKSLKKYLPKPLTEYILELYANKTELKGIPEKEDIYMQSKQYINSLFGMSVTAIMQADVTFDGENWYMEKLTSEMVDEYLDELRNPSRWEKRYFLSYSWGCWVTAYARRNLWRCIETVDTDLLYCDTDSIFVLGEHDFSWYNEEITEKLRKACEATGLDFNKTRPKTVKGKEKPLGIFDKEDNCTQFITLGAKRYVERRESDGQLHLTVSGINKGAVDLLDDDIENFRENFDFDKDADCVSKRLATYVDNMPTVEYPDGYVSTYRYGINMRRTGYKLTMTDEYKALIDYVTMVEEAPEQYRIHQRGKFEWSTNQ